MLSLAEIFQNGMTLQRRKKIKVWGTTDNAQLLKVCLNGKEVLEENVSAGPFVLYIPEQEAMEDAVLIIHGEKDTLELKQVDIGEVWIAGGQSNMEFCLNCDAEGDQIISKAHDCHLRYYDVGEYSFEGEKEEGIKDGSHWDRWMQCNSSDSRWFSAVGFYFARKIREALHVPVAVVGCNWGGTTASTWLDEKIIRNDELLKVYSETYDRESGKISPKKYLKRDAFIRRKQYEKKMDPAGDPMLKNENTHPTTWKEKIFIKLIWAVMVTGPHDPNRPGGLYKTMLSKISGYSCRGVIWYQGESDENHADLYARLFRKVIECWRKDWSEELPFLFVQLAPWEEWLYMYGRNYPAVRQQQQIVEDTVPNTYMASIMDIGCRYDIHPKHKRPVGERLALLAFDNVYGIPQKYARAPRITRIERSGRQIDILFDFAEDGLVADSDISELFDVQQDGRRLACKASIENNHVILDCGELQDKSMTISFAYRDYLVMTLKNKGGLPARPLAPTEVQ
jgi:sialate O-acetylesterase